MPKPIAETLVPNTKEDAIITKAAKANRDALPYTDVEWNKAKATACVGHPKAESPKVFTGIRLDADVVESFKATGKGWHTRMNAALRDWLKTHSPT